MRRMFFSWIGMSLVAGSAGFVSADGGGMPAAPVVVQPTAQPRVGNSAAPRRPTVRRYRSYSIDPGVAGAAAGAVEAPPGVVRPAPGAGRPAKPSYMRGDSKARGQFNR